MQDVEDLAGRATVKKAQEPKKARKGVPWQIERLIWARAAGRCQYAGCNKLLIGDAISATPHANAAYVAHIVAAEPGGPRGDPVLSPLLAADPTNLMLGGVLINETARVPVDGPVHHRSPPRRVQVVPATAIIPK